MSEGKKKIVIEESDTSGTPLVQSTEKDLLTTHNMKRNNPDSVVSLQEPEIDTQAAFVERLFKETGGFGAF